MSLTTGAAPRTTVCETIVKFDGLLFGLPVKRSKKKKVRGGKPTLAGRGTSRADHTGTLSLWMDGDKAAPASPASPAASDAGARPKSPPRLGDTAGVRRSRAGERSVWSQGDPARVRWSIPGDSDDDVKGANHDVIDKVIREGTRGQRISKIRISVDRPRETYKEVVRVNDSRSTTLDSGYGNDEGYDEEESHSDHTHSHRQSRRQKDDSTYKTVNIRLPNVPRQSRQCQECGCSPRMTVNINIW